MNNNLEIMRYKINNEPLQIKDQHDMIDVVTKSIFDTQYRYLDLTEQIIVFQQMLDHNLSTH
jgi:hypothetical protein